MAFNLFRRKKDKNKEQDEDALPVEDAFTEEEAALSDEEIEKILASEQEEPDWPAADAGLASDTATKTETDHQPEHHAESDAPPFPATFDADHRAETSAAEQFEVPIAKEDAEAPDETVETAPEQWPDEEDVADLIAGEEETAAEADTEDAPTKGKGKGLYARLRKGLAKTRQVLTTDVDKLFRPGKPLDEETLDYLEEMLITSDIGVQPATELIETLSKSRSAIKDADQLKEALKTQILHYIKDSGVQDPDIVEGLTAKPHVIMVVGVNGVGKTTTIGKLAAHYKAAGKKVLIVAADTFRAAAIEQLSIWAERAGADIVKHRDNSDPAAVAFDGMEAAQARDIDVVIVDTAGRLHTKVNLMEELKKIRRTIEKKIIEAPHEVLLVLDATTGQNAISQTRMFSETIGVTGFVLTKLDGTAKGGIVINLCHTFEIPLQFIGVGEQIDDLQVFDPEKFLDAMF